MLCRSSPDSDASKAVKCRESDQVGLTGNSGPGGLGTKQFDLMNLGVAV